MTYDRELGLDKYEIQLRDEAIQLAITEIKSFDERYNLELPVKSFISELTPGLPDNVVYQGAKPKFDSYWVNKRIHSIKAKILKQIADRILIRVEILQVGDSLLRGGCFSISLRLCINYFHKGRRFSEEEQDLDFDIPLDKLQIKFWDCVETISETYKKKYMRYRLWDSKAIFQLKTYLFEGNSEYEICEGPALEDYIDLDGEKLTKGEFIEIVDEAIVDLPRIDCCEIQFPEPGCSGYIFSEYVPVKHMEDLLLNNLYQFYLSHSG